MIRPVWDSYKEYHSKVEVQETIFQRMDRKLYEKEDDDEIIPKSTVRVVNPWADSSSNNSNNNSNNNNNNNNNNDSNSNNNSNNSNNVVIDVVKVKVEEKKDDVDVELERLKVLNPNLDLDKLDTLRKKFFALDWGDL